MTDPDRGSAPQVEGTTAGSRGKAKAFRRDRSKRNGAGASSAATAAADQAQDGPVARPAGTPASGNAASVHGASVHGASGNERSNSEHSALDNGQPNRKRKRRRRSRGGGEARTAGEAAGGESAASRGAQSGPDAGAQSASGGQKGGHRQGQASGANQGHNGQRQGKKSRKHNNRRGPQGRALVSGDKSGDKASVMKSAGADASTARPAPQRHPEQREASHPGHGHQPGHHHGNGRRGEGGRRADGRQPRPRLEDDLPGDLYAALDLGTNNCRLLIAQPTRPGQFRVVDAFSRIVRLGEGLGSSGRLSAEAMDRAVEALRICAGKLKGREIKRMRLIATEACRAAENGEEFLARVVEETGLDLEIINRETEARLAVSGCSSLVGRDARSVVLFDIGGGSSEIAVLRIGDNRSNRLANHITHWTSLPVGVVTLSERHGGRDVTPDVFEAMIAEVAGMLDAFESPPVVPGSAEDFYLIGTSGTVTTLAGVHLDLPRYDRRKVDGVWLSDQEVSAMQARLLSWDYLSRAANPCIGPDRADLVLAGCAILEAIRRRWPARRMRVADRGLREGLLTDMMADDGVWRRGRSRRPFRERER